jgi:hypothetical protein
LFRANTPTQQLLHLPVWRHAAEKNGKPASAGVALRCHQLTNGFAKQGDLIE